MKHAPASFDTYLQGIDFSKVTPVLRVSFDIYRTASDRYRDQYRANHASALQAHTAANERFQAFRERPKSDALALLKDLIQQCPSQHKSREESQQHQQLARVELDRFVNEYTQSHNRFIHVYKGLQERGELTRQDKRLLDALCHHDLASFREDQQQLAKILSSV